MSHLHIPDGVVPIGWILVWFAVALAWLGLSFYMLRHEERSRLVPRIGIFAAVMILGMSVEWFGVYHLNLTAFAGITLGPWAGFVAQFLANVILALMGHGGLTTLGLNSVVLGSEVVVGYLVFRLFAWIWVVRGDRTARKLGISAFCTTLIALILSFSLAVGGVALALGQQGGVAELFSHHHHTSEHGHEPAQAPEMAGQSLDIQTAVPGHFHQGDGSAGHETAERFSIVNFMRIVLVPGLMGWVVEALIVALLVGYIARVRPGFFERYTRSVK